MTKTHILVRQPEFFTAKQECHTAGMLPRRRHTRLEQLHVLLRNPMLPRRRPQYQRAIAHRFSHRRKDPGIAKNMSAPNGRYRFAKRQIIGIHQAKVVEAKIRDRARSRPDVERVPCGHQNDCQFAGDVMSMDMALLGAPSARSYRKIVSFSRSGHGGSVESKLCARCGPRKGKIFAHVAGASVYIGGRMASAVEQKVKQIIVEQLGVDESQVDNKASFVDDLGADSLDIVELVMAFEEAFELEIPDEDAEKIGTVGDAVTYIENKKK